MHPVDALKHFGAPLSPEAEARMRAICDEEVDIGETELRTGGGIEAMAAHASPSISPESRKLLAQVLRDFADKVERGERVVTDCATNAELVDTPLGQQPTGKRVLTIRYVEN